MEKCQAETLDYDTNEAQTPVDAMCDVNQMFRMEENFVNCKKENCEQQCVQQCTLNNRLKKHGKRGEDAVLKEIAQLHDISSQSRLKT